MNGSVYQRCSCRDPKTNRQLGTACPRLKQRKHGNWYLRQELPDTADGERQTLRRGGYASKTDAQDDLRLAQSLLALPDASDIEGQRTVADMLQAAVRNKETFPSIEDTTRRLKSGQALVMRLTVGWFLEEWLAGKKVGKGTHRSYGGHIRNHLAPRIGHIRLDKLRVADLSEMFQAIADANVEIREQNAQRHQALALLKEIPIEGAGNRARRAAIRESIAQMPPFRRPTEATTRQRIRATLRAALNSAMAQQLIIFNPAAHVELDSARRPRALVWTPERVERWRKTGQRPSPVMVWTPEMTGQFLDHVATDRLYAMWHLLAYRGPRRGEVCGLAWSETHLDAQRVTISNQTIVVDGWTLEDSAPKTDWGFRTLALDAQTVSALRAHRARQAAERLQQGEAWVDTDRVFTEPDGSWLHPDRVSKAFEKIVSEIGLPPIRLHDLRHGAATLALAAGVDIKLVSEMLGHSTVLITQDIYQSVLDDLSLDAAEATARVVPRRA
ncbi:tyrosine-type recombinase/integrase [Streptomyces phyllanthi]|uniref:Site-specific integrase n=1 Tax=Streptomyces phyllanthi TaxID=1803180 RepID=A0A5N8W828_9ACTN|nr:site-specific integrase [Streptomyces phyllanthi]MPY42548.1 site-specific integrase [Streptomyces phyllanthi]